MPSDGLLKESLSELLRQRGFEVAPVPRGSSRTADLLVRDEGDEYLVEVKSRQSTGELAEGVVRLDSAGYTNRTSGILRGAANQLEASDAPDALKLVWVLSPEPDRHLRYRQFESTAYGILIAVGQGQAKPCYYATHADFYSFRNAVDGVALGTFAALLINDLSPRYARLKASRLVTLFGTFVRDPALLESQGQAYVVRGDLDRTSKSAVIDYLAREYGISVSELTQITRFVA
jgi:hypothetical protein